MKKSKALLSLFSAAILVLVSVFSLAFFASADTLYYGDADNDGTVSASDARLILRIAVELDTYDINYMYRYDTNNDEKIAAADARLALRMSVNLEEKIAYVPIPAAGSDEEIVAKISEQIAYLSDGNFYIKAATVDSTGAVGAPMSIATNGTNVYFSSDFGGFELGVLSTGKTNQKLYMISDEHKTYVQLTDALLGLMGISKDDLVYDFSFDSANIDGLDYTVKTEGTSKVFTFTQGDGVFSTIATDFAGKITRLISYDKDNNVTSDMMIYELKDTAPAELMSIPDSYTNSILASAFFAKIMVA